MPPPALRYRKTLSTLQLSRTLFAGFVDELGDRGVGGFALINPDSELLAQRRFSPHRSKRDTLAFTFEFQRRSRRQSHSVPYRLGKNYPPCAIQSYLSA